MHCWPIFIKLIREDLIEKGKRNEAKDSLLDLRRFKGRRGQVIGHFRGNRGINELIPKEEIVMPVKPALYLSEKNLGVRIKDAIPIIKVSSMVLSIDWPREIDEIKARLIKINF